MSISGKLARGEQYLMNKVAIEQPEYLPYGEVFMPEGIINDPNKMKDIDFYLNSKKTETKPVEKPKIVEKSTPKQTFTAKEE